jgi:DNA-binding transcriptional LysR family regulator
MLELRRLRLLRELHERGTIAAVADALQFTPSAVSQQLAMLERETGVRLLEKAGRGVRLTDPALVLVEHAGALLDRAAIAEADLAAAAGTVGGRARIATFQSAAIHIAAPAIEALATTAPKLRCELIEAEPETALPELALGGIDLVIGDEWPHHPWRMPAGLTREKLLDDPVFLVGEETSAWASSQPGLAWEEMTRRTCREQFGFDPDIRHRCENATVALALVARGLAVTLLPELALKEARVPLRRLDGVARAIYAVTRAADAARPSTRALLEAVRAT